MERIGVVGLGYVGLPVALAFARKFEGTVGFDISQRRIGELLEHRDSTREVTTEELAQSRLHLTADAAELEGCSFIVIAVPTPIDDAKRPDLEPLRAAARSIGPVLQPGAVVVLESTVYPGVTEDILGPLLAQISGLRQGSDFHLGYSPERINPGDKEHRLETIMKVVSGDDEETLRRVSSAYAAIVDAGVHEAPSIRVAEAAKVIENTQRDLNIALMNELALIFDRLGIATTEVLAAARTKWNFLPFTPGLVGGHCIGVDPYYLTAAAEKLGYHPEVILAGRRINDSMGTQVAHRIIKELGRSGRPIKGARVGILGLTFKEDVPDLRNSKVPDIIRELADFGTEVWVHDPVASPEEAVRHFGILPVESSALVDLDALVLAVPHRVVLEQGLEWLTGRLRSGGVLMDVKSAVDRRALPPSIRYLAL